MRKIDGFIAGHLNGSIRELLNMTQGWLMHQPWAVITSVDSLRDLYDLSTWKAPGPIAREARPLGSAIFVRTNALVEAAAQGALSGFDEVWFCREPPIAPPPKEAGLVGPRDVESEVVREALDWMAAESCEVGLGDGIGLNYLTKAKQIALEIEQAFGRRPG